MAELIRSAREHAEPETQDQDEKPEETSAKLFEVLTDAPKDIIARLLFQLEGRQEAMELSDMMNIDLVEVVLTSSQPLPQLLDANPINSTLQPLSMQVVSYLAEREAPLPNSRSPTAPLLATISCLERRATRWPSRRFFQFSLQESERFPALHRWIVERKKVWDAIRWAEDDSKKSSNSQGSTECEPEFIDDLSDDDETPTSSTGLTAEQLNLLDTNNRKAYSAVGIDEEGGLCAAYRKLIHALIKENKFEQALNVCDTHIPLDDPLQDEVLRLALQNRKSIVKAGLLDHEALYRITDTTLAAKMTLHHYKNWDVDTAIGAVNMCLNSCDSSEFSDRLSSILERLTIFRKVIHVVGSRWNVWQELADMDTQQVSSTVDHLLSLQQHDLAGSLCQMYGRSDLMQSLELSRLHHLFTTENDKTAAVNRLCSFDPTKAASLALSLLDRLDLISHRVLLVRLLLNNFRAWLSPTELETCRVQHASYQLLSSVSEDMQSHFLPLVNSPVLIVESLLMNARVDLLAPFLNDFPEFRRDGLTLSYVRKALALAFDANEPVVRDTDRFIPNEHLDEREAAKYGMGGRWCLTGDIVKDRQIRASHTFEDAPSIKLAEKIIDLCVDDVENASVCFDICNELSFGLHALMPSASFDEVDSSPVPLSSVSVVLAMIRRLLQYLPTKFLNAKDLMLTQFERSLDNLDLIPLIWQQSGHKVGLRDLCDR